MEDRAYIHYAWTGSGNTTPMALNEMSAQYSTPNYAYGSCNHVSAKEGWRAFSRVVVRCFYLLGFRFTLPVSLLEMRRVTRFQGTLYVFEVQVPEMYQ
jgi:hypothetical protein